MIKYIFQLYKYIDIKPVLVAEIEVKCLGDDSAFKLKSVIDNALTFHGFVDFYAVSE